MNGQTEIQDLVVWDTWIDKKTGEERSRSRQVGVSIKMKGGGWRHVPFKNVMLGECMSLPRKPKEHGRRGDIGEPGLEDDGAHLLDE